MKFSGGVRKKTKRSRSSRKVVKKGKVGAKSNPFPSKRKAAKSNKKGVKYYKKAGRTYKLGKKH